MHKKHSAFLLLAVVVFFFLQAAAQPLAPLPVKLHQVAKGLTAPVGMAVPDDGTHRLFIVGQSGKISIIKNGVVLGIPFLDISRKLDNLNPSYSEKGLLGLAFHPAYRTNGRFFVYYSAPYPGRGYDHKSILAEYRVSARNPDIAATEEKVLMEILQPEGNHNGGCLQFGKDGYLYIGVGDGGGAGDRHGSTGNGQDLNTLLGKILRIDVNGAAPYSVPADNPFAKKAGAKPEIYAYGLRNPWRFSFDRTTGTLFCGDVGQDKWEEINIIRKGKNYGWRIMEGAHCFKPASGCETRGLELPINEYDHDTGVSICGGYMYRGQSRPALHGTYFFADWSGKLFYLRQDKDGSWKRGEVRADGRKTHDIGTGINSLGEDDRGEIYIITQQAIGPKSTTGALYRIEF